MRLTTIWSPRFKGMPLRERLTRTGEWTVRVIGSHLPERLKYWAAISFVSQRIEDDEIVPEVRFVDILGRPRRVG